MKRFMKRMIAGLMTMAMFIALFVNCGNVYEVKAATKYTLEEKTYKGKEYPGVDKGYYYIPTNVKGTLPAVVFIHGMGGLKKDIYKRQVERFINSGYISPFVLIMPNLEGVGHDAYVCKDKAKGEEWLGRVIDRMDNGEFDTKDVKIDKTSGYSITGYSMGGSSAVLAGIAYNKKFINVGGLSPSVQLHYPAWGVSWIMESSETKSCKFTNNSKRHLLFSSGSSKNENTGEKEDAHLACVKRCLNLFGDDNGFAQVVYDYEEHNAYLFSQEFFNFLYYIQHDELPSDDIIRKVFEDDIDYLEGIPNPGPISRKRIIMPSDQKSSNGKPVINSITPSVSDNTVKMGQSYSISVNATGSSLSYQWMWRTDKSDWKASGCSGSKEATIQLEGKRPVVFYKCIVSNTSGTVESKEIQINLAKPVLKSSLSNNTVKKGQNYTISVDVKNPKVTYKWEYNKHDGYGWKVSQVSGCTTDTLYLTGKNPVITYKCTVTYKDGNNTFSVTSDEITITMAE